MKKEYLLLLFLIGCSAPTSICTSPYFEWQLGKCCLDANANKICDSDELKVSEQPPTVSPPIVEKVEPPKKINAPKSVDRIVKDSLDKVLKVYVQHKEGTMLGSAFPVSEEGIIVTNMHVVEPLLNYYNWAPVMGNPNLPIKIVNREGDEIDGENITFLGGIPEADLAFLKLNTAKQLYFELAPSYKIKPGDVVYALGAPQGLDYSASKGVVSAKNRPALYEGGPARYLQTDAAINGGNSGGPLINEEGSVFGMNTFKYSDEGIEGLGFALEGEIIKEYLDGFKRIQSRFPNIICRSKKDGSVECEREAAQPAKPIKGNSKDVLVSEFKVDEFSIAITAKNPTNETQNLCFKVMSVQNGKIVREEKLGTRLELKPRVNMVQNIKERVLIRKSDVWDEYHEVQATNCDDMTESYASTYIRWLNVV